MSYGVGHCQPGITENKSMHVYMYIYVCILFFLKIAIVIIVFKQVSKTMKVYISSNDKPN